MSASYVLLIVISGLGVLHGLLFAMYLLFFLKPRTNSNIIFSLLLFVLSFRVGKSVIMEFASNSSLKLIFVGLATLLLIGPLFFIYTQSVLNKAFQFHKALLLHFILFVPSAIFGLIINKTIVSQTHTFAFIGMFAILYGHYLVYLAISYNAIKKAQKTNGSTKEITFLKLLCCSLLAIWIVYVLNLFEQSIPYILGPVLYSVIVYSVTFLVIKNGYISKSNALKYSTTALNEGQAIELYDSVRNLVENDLFKDANLNLSILSKRLQVSPQKISMAINLNYGSNFNVFVNNIRIKQAQKLLVDKSYQNYTIAFIAFETGFTSLSTFNSAFKKETGETPSTYRKNIVLSKA